MERLRQQVRGRVLLPGDPDYDLERGGWNLHVDGRPYLIVVAACVDDVVSAVRFARHEELPVAVQATGHGQARRADRAVLVKTTGLSGLAIDAERRTARVGAGVRWRRVIDGAAPHGLAPLNGSTSHIGAAGYLTGGGLPVLGRRYGFGVDHVRALEIVTADGCRRRATPRRHRDLFWAVRGGTSNFGIVSAVEIDLVAQPRFYGGGLFFPGERAEQVIRGWLDWATAQPATMGTSLLWVRFPDLPTVPEDVRGRFVIHIRIASTEDADAAAVRVAALRGLGPVLDTVVERPYTQIDDVHQDPTQPTAALELSSTLGPLDDGFADELLSVAGPDASSPPDVVEIRLLGGALAQRPSRPSALGHRRADFNLLLGAFAPPGQVPRGQAQLRAALAPLQPWSTGGAFPNFLGGSGHTDSGRVRHAYDADDYPRLRRLKARHDPDNVFRINHNIRPRE